MAANVPIVAVPLRCSSCGGHVVLRYRFDQRLPRQFQRWTCPYNDCRGTSLALLSGDVIDTGPYSGPLATDG